MNEASAPKRKAEGERPVTGLQFHKKNNAGKTKRGDCEVVSSQNVKHITNNINKLASERILLSVSEAPLPECIKVESIDSCDDRHTNENTTSSAVKLDAGTNEPLKDLHKDTQSLQRDSSCVIKSEIHSVISTVREEPLEAPVHEAEIKDVENRDKETDGKHYATNVLNVFSSLTNPDQLACAEENVSSDIYQDEECTRKGNSLKNLSREKKLRTTNSKVAAKWSIDEFSQSLTNTPSKSESRHLFSNHLKCSGSHFVRMTDLDHILLNDEKLGKEVCVVMKKLPPSLLYEAGNKIEMHNKSQETCMANNNMIDTQKFRSFFSLKDSGKPDSIKPSMLKRNLQDDVYVSRSHLDAEKKTCISPDSNASLEASIGKQSNANKNKSEYCNASSCHQMKNNRMHDLSFNSTKRQKTASKGICFASRESESDKCDTALSKEEINGKMMSLSSVKSKTVSDCSSRKCSSTIYRPTTDLDSEHSLRLDKERYSAKQTIKKQDKMSCSSKEPEVLLCNTVSETSQCEVRHSSHNIRQHSCEEKLWIEENCNKRKRYKRKLECEWSEAADYFHPKKKKCQVIADRMKNSEHDLKETPVTDNGNFSLPLALKKLQDEVRNSGTDQECIPVRDSGTQNSDYIEQQQKNKQQLENSEIKDTDGFQHSSHTKSTEISKTFQLMEKVQVKDSQEIQDFLFHKIDSLRKESLHKSLDLYSVKKNYTENMYRPEGGGKLHGNRGAVSNSQWESPSLNSPQAQHSNYPSSAASLSFLPEEMIQDCNLRVIEAAASPEQGLCPGSKSNAGIFNHNGLLVKHNNTKKKENNLTHLQCESHPYIKCDEIEKRRRNSSTNCVVSPKLYVSDESCLTNNDCLDAQDLISQFKEGFLGKNNNKNISVNCLQQPLKDNLTSAEESKYKKEILPTNPLLPEKQKTSISPSPCPKVLAKRMVNNLKYCMLNRNSSSGSSCLDFNKKYEYLPILQASLETFFTSQSTSKQSEQSSEIISLGYKKEVIEKILMNMRLQLQIDANLVNDEGQFSLSSSMETLALFIDGQAVSSSQATDLPEILDNTEPSVIINCLSPQCVKSLIAQQVSELHCPYKASNMKPFYGTPCRVVVSSAIFIKNPTNQGVPVNFSPEGFSSPLEAKQQHCSSISLRKDQLQEIISPASFSSTLQRDHISNTTKTIERPVFVPNELYQPFWENFPCQHPFDGKQNCKFIHLFQGKQQDIIKLKVRI